MVEDFFCILMLYPLAAFQADQHMIDNDPDGLRKKNDDLPMNGLTKTSSPYPPEAAYMPSEKDNQAYILNEMPRESIHL